MLCGGIIPRLPRCLVPAPRKLPNKYVWKSILPIPDTHHPPRRAEISDVGGGGGRPDLAPAPYLFGARGPFSWGRGGDNLVGDGDVEGNPGPFGRGSLRGGVTLLAVGYVEANPTPQAVWSLGRGGAGALQSCGDVEANPGPQGPQLGRGCRSQVPLVVCVSCGGVPCVCGAEEAPSSLASLATSETDSQQSEEVLVTDEATNENFPEIDEHIPLSQAFAPPIPNVTIDAPTCDGELSNDDEQVPVIDEATNGNFPEIDEHIPLSQAFAPPIQNVTIDAPTQEPVVCTCGKPKGKQGRHHSFCAISASSAKATKVPRRAVDVRPFSLHSPAAPLPPCFDLAGFVLDEVLALRPPLLRTVPVSARQTAQATLTCALTHGATENAWKRLLAAWTLLFAVSPTGHHGAEVRRRCALFGSGDFSPLIDEARGIALAHKQSDGGTAKTYPIVDDECRWRLSVSTDANILHARVAERIVSCVERGEIGRANAMLSQATVVRPSDAGLVGLQALHPGAAHPTVIPSLAHANVPPLSPKVLLRLLRSFQKGSSAGVDGIAPGMLLELCTTGGSTLAEALCPFVYAVAQGTVPDSLRSTVFGARLVALLKKDGSLRPIAAGSVLRRLGAKFLCSLVKERAGKLFADVGQIGVGVRGGTDRLFHCVRRISARLGTGVHFLKVDFQNAFNLVDRSAMLAETALHFPALLGYVTAAYGASHSLRWGDHRIPSCCGVHQGDPLGPLLFCLVLKRMLVGAPSSPFQGWYLDDGVVGGDESFVANFLAHVRRVGPPLGLVLKDAKCELISRVPPTTTFCPEIPRRPCDNWQLLGGCVGSATAVDAHLEPLVQKVERHCALLAALAESAPHAALMLLKACGGTASMNHFMRLNGNGSQSL